MAYRRSREELRKLAHRLRLVTRDIFAEVRDAQLPLAASSLAYITILSIIPLLAVSFSIFSAFGGAERLYSMIEPFIIQNLAQAASADAMETIRGFISNIHAATLGVTGLVALIFTSMSLLSSAETAINRVWKTRVQRSLFHRIASYWLFITLGPLAIAIVVGIATSSRIPLSNILPSGTGLYLLTVAVFFLVYKFVPARKVNWQPALIAAFLMGALFYLAKFGYGVYASHVVTYRSIYGSLAAIPLLLLWIYIVWLVILAGAAVTSAVQKHFDFKWEIR